MHLGIFAAKPWEKEYLEQQFEGSGFALTFFEHELDADHLPKERSFDAVSVFVGSRVDQAVLDALPDLRIIATRSTGYDHIDFAACAARGIIVSNVPAYGENTVAEMTFALLLALSRRIYESYERVREDGNFSQEGLKGFDLQGKTLGVVGTGRIGRHVIRIAKGFEMEVLATDPHPDAAFAKEAGFTYMALEELLVASDIVSLHVPYLPATHHLLNEERIGMMRRGAILINTARGAIVETEALVKALESGQLGGAGLDVLEEEGVIGDELEFLVSGRTDGHDLKTVLANHALMHMPNVIVTPHNAFNTAEALTRILETTAANLKTFLAGKPENTVQP